MNPLNVLVKGRPATRWTRFAVAGLFAAVLAGCGGSDGAPGAAGKDGTNVDPTVVNDLTAKIDALTAAQIKPEQCSLCHAGTNPPAKTGADHEALYAKYINSVKGSNLTLSIDNVTTVAGTTYGTYDTTLTFTAKKSGVGLTRQNVLDLAQKAFKIAKYDSATRKFSLPISFATPKAVTDLGTADSATGTYSITYKGAKFNASASDAQAYGYIANDNLALTKSDSHVQLYGNLASAAKVFGGATTSPANYVSAAKVSGCETCHGKPYLKHGYRAANVDGLPDFGACRSCHTEDSPKTGMSLYMLKSDLKYIIANPIDATKTASAQLYSAAEVTAAQARLEALAVNATLTTAEKAKYPYAMTVYEDTHISHAQDFPYPQSMQSCVTCHEGNLGSDNTKPTDIFNDNKFVASTCITCHSVEGLKGKMRVKTSTLKAISVHDSLIAKMDDGAKRDEVTCVTCHGVTNTLGAPTFSALHKGGYNPKIYTATGDRYSTKVTVTTPAVTISGNVLTIKFTATSALASLKASDITPTVLVGLYGYNSKDFIVAAHGSQPDKSRNLEYVVGTTNPRFKTVTAANGSWEVTADLSLWADKIAAGVIKRAEVAVMPTLKAGSTTLKGLGSQQVLALNAPSVTFNLDGKTDDSKYFSGIVNATKTTASSASVDVGTTKAQVNGCDSCHDALGTTFHSADRGGNIKVCRICHEVSNAGSHLELQSRSIDSYVHSIHSFQVLDAKNVDLSDPAALEEYEAHTSHNLPRFTIQNCEACHVTPAAGATTTAYDVPNQAKSMPGVLSGSAALAGRTIPTIPAAVTGPAVRACGGCHRAQAINEDDGGKLATMIAHWQANGMYVYVTDTAATLWAAVVAKIMALFN